MPGEWHTSLAPTAGPAPIQAHTLLAGPALLHPPFLLLTRCLLNTHEPSFCMYTKELQIHHCLVHDHLNLRGFKSRNCSSKLVKNYC